MPPKSRARAKSKPKATATKAKTSSSRKGTKQKAGGVKRAKCTTPTPPPLTGALPTLLLDTGGWTIRHAVLHPTPVQTGDMNVEVKPTHSPNVSAKPKHQLTTLLASQVNTIQNKSQLIVTRPMERGYITDLGTQFQIWDVILQTENLDTNHSFSNGGVRGVMPSLLSNKKKTPMMGMGGDGGNVNKMFTHTTAVFTLCQPFTPRCIIDNEDEVWYRDFGFGRVGRRLGACCSAYKYLQEGKGGKRQNVNDSIVIDDDETGCCCVIDCGFSMTSIVPTVNTSAIEKGIKRINVGGKLLTNLLKQTVSYRKFNLMDEFYIVNEAKESLCFVSMDFDKDMKIARESREGTREYDREFVLPDFADTFHGSVRLPPMLQRMQDLEQREQSKNMQDGPSHKEVPSDQKADEDETTKEQEKMECEDENSDQDSDDETEEQARLRILKQREEERRRRELEESERQALLISVERFTIPEVLFRPSDIGMEQLGLAESIVQSIEALDPIYRAAMYQNIILTGGNVKIPYFRERLEAELRTIAPINYKIRIYVPKDPENYAWNGAQALIRDEKFVGNIYMDRTEYETMKESGGSSNGIWNAKLNQGLEPGFTYI